MQQFSSFNFIALIAILLFSLMLIAAQPKGKFISPVQPEINAVTIQSNENVYVYGAGKVAQLQSTGIKYFHNDYLGTPRLETSASKNIVTSNNQYPFGEKLSQQGAERYVFTGKELDDTGLQYFGARFYDSSSGRFTQVDPVGVGYAYTANNPLKFVDPTGNDEEWAAVNPEYDTYNPFLPFLTHPPEKYKSPLELFFTGHPRRAFEQYSLNLQQSQAWRTNEGVDFVATGAEVAAGKTSPIWLVLAAAPGSSGSMKKAEKVAESGGLFRKAATAIRRLFTERVAVVKTGKPSYLHVGGGKYVQVSWREVKIKKPAMFGKSAEEVIVREVELTPDPRFFSVDEKYGAHPERMLNKKEIEKINELIEPLKDMSRDFKEMIEEAKPK